ncbi:MAG: ABC transporter ATP-binding protein, partial [Terriglobia bacterium]
LTQRLQGFETVLVTAEGPGGEMKARLERVQGVTLVEERDAANGRVTFEVHAGKERDIRAELARAVVESRWSLIELRASGLSLEDIFLKLTTQDETN